MLTLYHGTDAVAAKKIASDKFEPKPNPCHWLGNGIYFYFDKSLAEWWTTNPSSKFGCRVSNPALLKVEVEIDETEILDLRRFDTYVEIANEFERFFTQLYIPFHRETISEMQIKCLFFDWYFLSNKNIKMIIGDFYSLNQPYFEHNERDFYEHTNLLFGETQVCLKTDYQNIIINKEVVELCNSVLNLTVRDDEIGWTVEAISKQLLRKKEVSHSAQIVSGTNGKTVGAKIERFLESDEEYGKRIREYSSKTISILMNNIEMAIKDLYVRDLNYHRGTKYPKNEKVDELIALSNRLRNLAIDNKKATGKINFEQEAKEILFKKKRAAELARLLEAKIIFNKYRADDTSEAMADTYLERAMEFDEAKTSAQAILNAFDSFMDKRKDILHYTLRLQDMPMLLIASKSKLFSEYLSAYEKLLSAIRENFSKLQDLDSIGAKNVIGALVALDVVYIVGRNNSHAMPTPLNPLYLWKYIKLAEEMINSKGIPEGELYHLSEADKDFIIRKAEDIPDPLALIMLPKNEITTTECLPFAGRIGCMPRNACFCLCLSI